ncbi:IS4 family transposase, partial [Legionella pneumophila]
EKSCPNIHKKRSVCLFEVVGSLIDCGKLWISALGRGLKNHTTAKHNIKKVDTLVGNRKLHDERDCFYNYVATTLIGTKTRPIIIVDWSPVSADCKHYFLRASVTGIGRSMTIYEEV